MSALLYSIMAAKSRKATNLWVARIIPLILIGLIIYSAYVVTKVFAIGYLINPPWGLVQRRPGSAAAILLCYYLLLIPVIFCYARLIQTIVTNPGYLPRGAAWYQQRADAIAHKQGARRGYHRKRRSISEKASNSVPPWPIGSQDPETGSSNHSSLTTSKEHTTHPSPHGNDHLSTDIPFWQRDIFVCNPDGRPAFCSTCFNYKPDRTHHCSEVDRCVLKMDHFCPWVGGIVSETSFKFFIQFCTYAALFCLMVLTTTAVFIAERRRRQPGFLEVHYYVLLGISALFLLFTFGMACSSIQFALLNTTTVENLNRRTKVWFLAVLIPRTEDGSLPTPPAGVTGPRFQTITYPRPPQEEQFLIHQAHSQTNDKNYVPALPPPQSPPFESTTSTPPRTFAILSTEPGENPFDVGPWTNIREVMGYSFWDWVLPIKQSPCTDHTSRVSAFKMDMGLVRRLQEDAGLVERRARRVRRRGDSSSDRETQATAEDYGSRRKKRRRRRSEGER